MGSNRQGEGGALGKYIGKIKHSKIYVYDKSGAAGPEEISNVLEVLKKNLLVYYKFQCSVISKLT